MKATCFAAIVLAGTIAIVVHAADPPSPKASARQPSWNPRAAAKSMDARLDWWSTWPGAARDHETFCVSCHTAAPYALSRSSLRRLLAEESASPQEKKLHANVARRVSLWNEVSPWYPDQTRGIPKTSESRGTESVMNAMVLSLRDAETGTLSTETRKAFANMWGLQMLAGDLKGGWAWLNFHYEPWEAPGSPYLGAALAAIAVGSAPGGYAASDEAKDGGARLKDYLVREQSKQNLYNKMMLLWASAKFAGILTTEQRVAIVLDVTTLQNVDGGWSTSALGTFKRVDNTPLDEQSDGLGTALVTLAMQKAGIPKSNLAVSKGLTWLERHQDPATGAWTASSLNKQRNPASDAGRFMSDAATAYAVLSLTNSR
jgi:squalene-hopene/tetraprenyl-beta-curcumene cyclase